MQTQQKAESDLLRIYGRMITIGLVLVIMAVIGAKYFFTPTANCGPWIRSRSCAFFKCTGDGALPMVIFGQAATIAVELGGV